MIDKGRIIREVNIAGSSQLPKNEGLAVGRAFFVGNFVCEMLCSLSP